MNLLPQENKEKIKKERRRRLIVVFGLFLTGLLVITLILLLPSFFFLVFEEKSLKIQFDSLQRNAGLAQAQEIELRTGELNKKIELYQAAKETGQNPSSFFEEILKVKPKGVSLNDFVFERLEKEKDRNFRIALRGRALSRDALLEFIKTLEKNKDFSRVHSPVSNLLKERDLEFSLVIEIKPSEAE